MLYKECFQLANMPDEGGLGIRRLTDFNEACLVKLAWQASVSSSLGLPGSYRSTSRICPRGSAPLVSLALVHGARLEE